ncbi:MAG: hypothetical protein OHK0035_10740 [Cyanobacteria bacterium J069]
MGTVLLWLGLAAPGQAHWADLAVAEVRVAESSVEMTLTYPTGLTAFADGDRNGQLSSQEVSDHLPALRSFLNRQIQVLDSDRRPGTLTLKSLDASAPIPTSVRTAPTSTHSTLRLTFAWPSPVRGLQMRYGLFLPGVPTASCLTTILQDGRLRTFLFTPTQQTLALASGLGGLGTRELLLAIAGAFAWGAVHSMSPGHGKTVVGAYLVGERATPKHAVFLALTTTITHTLGVFALGLVTLFAAQYVLPEQLYPWLSLISGVMVVVIGVDLLRSRLRRKSEDHAHGLTHADAHTHAHADAHTHAHADAHTHAHADAHTHAHADAHADAHTHIESRSHALLHSISSPSQPSDLHQTHSHQAHHAVRLNSHEHAHDDAHSPLYSHSRQSARQHSHDISQSHTHDSKVHSPGHSHEHLHNHSHGHSHGHSHLPPGASGQPVTWRSLMALGISGGLVPCPAALVLLLSAIALGKTGFGLLLVLAFSLGLAGVLTGLGLMLVQAKHWFKRVPAPQRLTRTLPLVSALGITLLGAGISIKAFMQLSL